MLLTGMRILRHQDIFIVEQHVIEPAVDQPILHSKQPSAKEARPFDDHLDEQESLRRERHMKFVVRIILAFYHTNTRHAHANFDGVRMLPERYFGPLSETFVIGPEVHRVLRAH